MSCKHLVTVLVFCVCIGCGSSAGTSSQGISWFSDRADAVPGIDVGSVEIVTLTSGARPLTFAVWTDLNGHSSSRSGTGFYELIQQGSGGISFELRCETFDDQPATMTIDPAQYDLSNGALFLVSALDGKLRVLQLDQDMNEFPTNSSALVTLAKSHPEIRGFFTSGNEAKTKP